MSFFNECMEFMRDNGVGVSNSNKIKMTGEIERYQVDGDKKGSLNGWMIWRDGLKPSCTFGSWKEGTHYTWFAQDQSELSKSERDRMRREIAKARIEATRAHKEKDFFNKKNAAIEAGKVWDNALDHYIHGYYHEYVQRKQIVAFGSRVEHETNALIIPVVNHSNVIQSIQRIFPNGKKMFQKGGAISGGFFIVSDGVKIKNRILITEGYATACSLHSMTGDPVVMCFNAGNIKHVTAIFKSQYPHCEIIICADNDHQLKENIGQVKAHEAASKCGVKVIDLLWSGGTDWNDAVCQLGYDEACSMFSVEYDKFRMGEPK